MQNLCEEKQHRMYVKMKNVPRKSRVYKLYICKMQTFTRQMQNLCRKQGFKCRFFVENAEMMLF